MTSDSRSYPGDYRSHDRERYWTAWPAIRRFGYPAPRADRFDQMTAIIEKLDARIASLEQRLSSITDTTIGRSDTAGSETW